MKKVQYVGKLSDFPHSDWVTRYERGYLSRKTQIDGDTAVFSAGDGRLFYYKPCFQSTQYILRVYLVKDGRFMYQ